MFTFDWLKDKALPARLVALCLLCGCAQPVGAQGQLPALTVAQQQSAPTFSLELPRRDQVFRVESDQDLLKRIRLDAEMRAKKEEYPKETVSSPRIRPRPPGSLPPTVATRVPYLVCYHPLYFQEKNPERYGLGFGPVQPVVSTGIFYLNTLLVPIHLLVQPPWTRECNSGYFLPGDRVPYKLYLWP